MAVITEDRKNQSSTRPVALDAADLYEDIMLNPENPLCDTVIKSGATTAEQLDRERIFFLASMAIG